MGLLFRNFLKIFLHIIFQYLDVNVGTGKSAFVPLEKSVLSLMGLKLHYGVVDPLCKFLFNIDVII